ncbi:MAG: flagellar type III secretion system pore protein FliP, partial [Planctomycetota bacterium]
MNKTLKSPFFMVMASLFFLPMLTTPAPAAETDPDSINTMPSVPDILRIVDKATADSETAEPNDWNTPVKLVVLFSLLALLPSIIAMTTSFTRIVIVLGFVRRALSTQNIPPNTAILGLAIFLTLYTMAPTFYQINEQAVQPYLNDQIQMAEGLEQTTGILKSFMIRQTRKNDLALFVKMAKVPVPEKVTDLGLHIVTPAFIISEFRTAFEIGCLMFIPFLLLDLVIASVLLSAGMMMLPPVMISLPFKLILFILV